MKNKNKIWKYSQIIIRYNSLWHDVEIVMKFKRIAKERKKLY